MGSCVTAEKDLHSKAVNYVDKPKVSKYTQVEIDMLKKMYNNLSNRCKNNILSREIFEIFFHASGLLGELMFTKFQCGDTGTITFNQLLIALELMVKGSFREKADVLFELYDIDKTNGIKYEELLKMLFSYPNEELNKMFTQPNFIEFIGEGQMAYYFGPSQKIQERAIIEEETEQSEDSETHNRRKNSVYAPSSTEYIEIQTKIRQAVEADKQKKKGQMPEIFKKSFKNQKEFAQVTRNLSTTQIQLKRSRKNLQIKSNIASLTKKYAAYLFNELKLDKEKDKFSKEQFFKLLEEHSSIFNVYFSGFHTYIWSAQAGGRFQYMEITPWIEGECEEFYKNDTNGRYLKYIRWTIFVFDHKKAEFPTEVINLEGLTVHEVTKDKSYGIVLKHRDGLYPEKQYYFPNKQIQESWVKQLAEFKESTIFDCYQKLQKIGGGNFSTVYKGKQKKTGKQVAIKVIEHFKLSNNEKQVIKRECGILKLCHHVNIIKFITEYKTKSHWYIVMELLSQGDLFEYTKKNTFLEEYEAAIIFKQVVSAIRYLNEEQGVIHRDLKPQNVIISMNEDKKMVKRAKIIDFGFGVYKDKLKDLPIKEKFAGTPGFIAPQIYKQLEYDEKVDTFSLGIILYFMLSGYLPFQSNFAEQIKELTLNCSISLTSAHWSNISENAKDLIYKMLTYPEERITTKQVEDHPWLDKIQDLKAFQGKNKKRRYI